jgi:uncharacterized protein
MLHFMRPFTKRLKRHWETGGKPMDIHMLDELRGHPEILEVLESSEFKDLDRFPHHGKITRMEHCLLVALRTYRLAKRRNLDYVSATRGALLHDFFFYDWRTEGPRLHGLRHPAIALGLARRRFRLNDIEEDAILRHMWPLTPVPPRYRESVIVSRSDKAVAMRDYRRALRFLRFPRIYTRKLKYN